MAKNTEGKKPHWVVVSSTDPFERLTAAEREAISLVRLMADMNESESTAYHTLLSAGEHVIAACSIAKHLDSESEKKDL